MRFIPREEVEDIFRDMSVAIVGSAPSCLDNKEGYIDSHDIVVRVNNYKIKGFEDKVGFRTDVHYSFYGSSIKKTRDQLKTDGVVLCMCKCPDDKFMESEWHRINKKEIGVDFRYIYKQRKDFWFCDTYIPTTQKFIEYFNILDGHIPTTGFACILDILSFECKSVYITGFDFFTSGLHNVDETWKSGRADDPIGHISELERKWVRNNLHRINVDKKLNDILV